MRLIDELRASRPQVIADALEAATKFWSTIENRLRNAALQGETSIRVQPANPTPLARAICAAVVEKARIEGFKVSRIVHDPDRVSAALGETEGVEWRIAW